MSHASQQVGVALPSIGKLFIGGSLHNSSIGGGKVVEWDCRRPVEVLAPSDSLVTLGKSPGTSCFASFEVLTFRSKTRLRNPVIRLHSTVLPPVGGVDQSFSNFIKV